MRKLLIAAAAMILAAGCANSPENVDPYAKLAPPPPPARDLRAPRPNPGSLFTQQASDFYTDLRARHVGDLIVVEIVENTKAKKKNDSKAERTNEFSAAVPNFLGLEDHFPRAKGGANSDPLISANFTSSHDATAEMTKEDTVTASIGCTVVEVLPGGNMLIRGSREVVVGGQTEHIILQGTVRPVDVTTANTVMSTQLANTKIYYTGRGTLTDKQQPGWLARLLDHAWPF